MKKNKTFIIIVAILISLIFIQLIYFEVKRKRENKNDTQIAEQIQNDTNSTAEKILDKKIYPINEGDVYENNTIIIDEDEFATEMYKIVFENFNIINENISNLSFEDTKEYYINNKEKINQMHIYSSDDLYLIAQQIKNIFNETIPYYYFTSISTDSIIKDENGYCKFDLSVNFINEQSVNLKVYLAKNKDINKKIILEDNSEINQLYEMANQSFNRSSAIEIIENIISNVAQIKKDTLGFSINKERQYFDLNQEKMNKLGIYSMDDFESFMASVKKVSWNTKDTITGYEIDTSNVTRNAEYLAAPLYIYYGNIEKIELKINVLSDKMNLIPQIKIS